VDLVTSVIEVVRSLPGENRISPASEITTIIYAKNPEDSVHYQTYSEDIKRLTRTNNLQIVNELPQTKGLARGVISKDLQVFIPLAGLIDFEAERQRLEKEIGKLKQEQERISKKLANKNFVERAPEEVVAGEKGKLAAMETKIEHLSEARDSLSK
jgi:valyl-tRNA synthetase